MSSTTYLSSVAVSQIVIAQHDIDTHITLGATALCVACGQEGPCPTRVRAALTFATYGRLPRRLPGASQPERVGLRLITTDNYR